MFDFWRNTPVVGPWLEGGEGLTQIPDYLLAGDFAYRKRPYPTEVPFADHLSVVRLLGGYDGDPTGARDLAFRDANGKIQYRMNLLKPRLQPYLDMGYDSLTLVLDNTPWCFPKNPVSPSGGLGQASPPKNDQEWYRFIQAVCNELVQILPPKAIEKLRFRVGTEDDSINRFNGSQGQFIWFYDATAAAVASVLPQAKVGPYNISDPSVLGVEKQDHVKTIPLAEQCVFHPNIFDKKRTRFDWVAYSKYFRPGDNPIAYVATCKSVWELFGQKVPPLEDVSREIHEFGIAPWGAKGTLVSAEPGALGATLTCQLMLGLREVGINRLWHWNSDMFDQFRNNQNQLLHLSTSNAWLLSVLERMAGGEHVVIPAPQSPNATLYTIDGSIKENESIFLVSAYNTNISQSEEEMVQFQVPKNLIRNPLANLRMVCLSRTTAVHDQIRRDLVKASLLSPDFISQPDRLGTVLQMGGPAAGIFVGQNWNTYIEQWTQSLTLKPLDPNLGSISEDGDSITFNLRLAPPMIMVLVG